MSNKNILITGGAGFIGSHIVEHCVNNKLYSIIRVIDNLSTGNKNNIQQYIDSGEIEFIYGDLCNIEICRKVVQNINCICHQAALGSVSRSIEDPLSSHMSNVNGFLNILIAARENNIKRIVYASSSSVYGDDQNLPKIEYNTGNVLSPYGATKKINEIYSNVFTKCYSLECIGLRYFNVFGPRQNPNGPYAAVIPKFIKLIKQNESPTINGDGTYSRDFTYVDNIVLANMLALNTINKDCFGEVFNIGAGGNYTILELFNTIKNELYSNINVVFSSNRDGDIPHSNADIQKAKELLGYNPITSFKVGIKKIINN
jgi:UDP-N-acetylglucosamine 4-epimerase